MYLLERKTPTQEEKDKMKLYHHVCFELLRNGTISLLEEYECKPDENVNMRKATLMSKHMMTVDEKMCIEPKHKYDYNKKAYDTRYYLKNGTKYYQANREKVLMKLKVKQICPICNHTHSKGGAHTHQNSKKHIHHQETGQPFIPKTSLERATQSWLKKREIPFKCDCGANIRSCSKLTHFKSRKHLNFMANQIVAQI